MELDPQTIRSVGFKLVKKGYDPDQVDAFRDEMASVVEAAHKQAIAMEARARAAVAKLHEVSQHAPERAADNFSPSDSDVITRTLALAQRAADTTVAEARAEAAAVVARSREEAEQLLDNARSVAAKTIEDSRAEARRAAEGDRVQAENELQSLLARRDFLVSDVDHLEKYLQEQRERVREAAAALHELVERVPGGLGDMRRPLLSASAEPSTPTTSLRDDADDSDDPSHDVDDVDDTMVAIDDSDVAIDDEMSELVWNDESIAAAERADELPFRPSAEAPERPGSRPPRPRRGAPSRFDDPAEQENVWRLLDEEVANAHASDGGLGFDDITTEVPVIPRATDTFRVSGDELQ